jgi:menaquinone-9 beta-reductase
MSDAAIIGAGPAGLSAAIALRRCGANVTVFEQHPVPPARVCGAFINPEGHAHLDSMGLMERVRDAGAIVVTDATVVAPDGRSSDVPIVRDERPGLALPRPVLERVMAEALRDAGGDVRWGARVTAAERRADGWGIDVVSGLTRASDTASMLVVADGRFSSLSGRPVRRARTGWFGWNTAFVGVSQAPGALSLYFYDRGYVGLLTFADGVTNICGMAALAGASVPRWESVLRSAASAHPALERALSAATRVDTFRGVGPLPFSRRMWPGRDVLVAGDAAAVGDPYMGEGISRALATGAVIVGAGLADGPTAQGFIARYNQDWRGRFHGRLRLGALLRLALARPSLGRPLVTGLVSRPSLLRRILNVAHDS